MEKRTVKRKTRPARRSRARPHVRPKTHAPRAAEPEPQVAGGGGSSGRGPSDDDDGGRKPERPSDGRAKLLIALGILAVGASVMTTRLIANSSRRRGA